MVGPCTCHCCIETLQVFLRVSWLVRSVTEMADSSRSQEIAVELSTTGVAEERTTPVETNIQPRKKQYRIRTPPGYNRKTCEGVVLTLAVVVGLAITSVPIVLYFTVAVSMSRSYITCWNQDAYPYVYTKLWKSVYAPGFWPTQMTIFLIWQLLHLYSFKYDLHLLTLGGKKFLWNLI